MGEEYGRGGVSKNFLSTYEHKKCERPIVLRWGRHTPLTLNFFFLLFLPTFTHSIFLLFLFISSSAFLLFPQCCLTPYFCPCFSSFFLLRSSSHTITFLYTSFSFLFPPFPLFPSISSSFTLLSLHFFPSLPSYPTIFPSSLLLLDSFPLFVFSRSFASLYTYINFSSDYLSSFPS